VKVAVGSRNPLKKQAAYNTFSRVFRQVEVVMSAVNSGVPAQLKGYDIVIGARQRAERSHKSVPDAHFGVGIESGLFDVFDEKLDVQVCSIFDGARHIIGASPGFTYPASVLNQIAAGRETGHIMEQLSGSAVGYLSKGLIDRTHFTELCIIMALIPRLNSEL
jgi:inosine/xanthosine triphosphatase